MQALFGETNEFMERTNKPFRDAFNGTERMAGACVCLGGRVWAHYLRSSTSILMY